MIFLSFMILTSIISSLHTLSKLWTSTPSTKITGMFRESCKIIFSCALIDEKKKQKGRYNNTLLHMLSILQLSIHFREVVTN